MNKNLLTGTVYKLLERITFIVISLLLTPFLINELGVDGYGFWLLALSILGWFNVIDLGFPAAVQRNLIFALESKSEEKVKTVFATSIVLFTTLGTISAFLLILIAKYSFFFFGQDDGLLPFILSVFAIKVVLDFFMNSFHGFFSAFLRYDIDSNLTSLNVIIKSALIVTLVPFYGIWGAVIATLFADIITNILKIFYAKKLHSPLSFSFRYASMSEAKALFSYSKHVIAAGVARTINSRADSYIINKVLDITSVATYGVANRLAMHIRAFVFTVNDMLTPIFTKKAANNENMEVTFHNAININYFTAAVLFTPLVALGHNFIMLWVGEDFSEAINLIYFIVFSFLCRVISSSINQVLFAQAKHKLVSIVAFIGAITNIILSIYFASIYGLLGIAIGTAIGFFISDVILSLILLKRYNEYSIKPVILNFVASSLFIYLFGLLLKQYIESSFNNDWLNLAWLSITTFIFTLSLSWFMILNNKLKQASSTYLQSIFSKMKRKFL